MAKGHVWKTTSLRQGRRRVSTNMNKGFEDVAEPPGKAPRDLEKSSEELLSEIALIEGSLNASADVFMIFDLEGRPVKWNKVATERSGYRDEELASMKATDLIAEECKRDVTEAIRSALEVGHGIVEAEVKTKKGDRIPAEFTGALLKDSKDKPIGLCVIGRDITERKRLDAELEDQYALTQVSEARYRRLFEASRDGILILDADTGLITDVNPFLEKLLGYSQQDFIGKQLWEIGPFKDIEESKKAFEELQANEYIRYDNLPLQTGDGRRMDVEFISSVYLVDHKRVIQCNIRDISDRRIAALRLKIAEEEHRSLFSSITDGVFIVDSAGNILGCNKASLDMLGYTNDEIKKMSFQQLTPEKWHQMNVDIYENQVKAYGCSDEYEQELIRKDGTVVPVSVKIWLTKDEEGRPSGAWGIVRDISERRRLEAERIELVHDLSERIKWLRVLYELSLAIEEEGITLEEILQRTAQLIPSSWHYPGDTCARVLLGDKEFKTANFQKTKLKQSADIMVRGKKEGAIEVCYLKERSEADKVPFLSEEHILIDLLADQLGRVVERLWAKDELAKSNAELEQFAYVASHDLQEPLRMVSSYVQLLKSRYEGKLDSDADDFIGYAVDGARHMQNLTSDLLDYSRVGTRGRPPKPTNTRVALDHALANLKVAIDESGAVITHDSLPTAIADETQLVSLFQNLIVNAINFRGDDPPRIHVSAERKGGSYLFSVRDNGIGIKPEESERIFQIFHRLHTRAKRPGTGIGLAICKKIVERHGGRIWVESEPGKGSTFYFALPAERTKRP